MGQIVMFDYIELDTETRAAVQQSTSRIKSLLRRSAQDIVDIGLELIAVQSHLPGEQFDGWLKAEFEWSRRTAFRFISVTNQFGAKLALNEIAPSALYLLAAPSTPDEARQEALARAEAGEVITHKEAQAIIKGCNVHVSRNSGENEWYTPEEYIEAVREVMGDIDLDPASSQIANERVKARRIYTIEDDGLTLPWKGRVWLNPPYSQPLIGQFIDKLIVEVNSGSVKQAIVLVNNATETQWWQSLAAIASAVCFPKGRVKFFDPDGNPGAPLQGQAILYIGTKSARFVEIFSRFGRSL